MNSTDPTSIREHKAGRYWRTTLRLTLVLLLPWFLVSFVVPFFAREVSQLNFFGFPFSFYMAAQGALLVYLLIVWIYAHVMDRLEQHSE